MLPRLVILLALGALGSATVMQITEERKIADAVFLKRQKQLLDLYLGIGHNEHFESEHKNWNMMDNLASFTEEKYPRMFMEAFHHGFLDREAIFSYGCQKSVNESIMLFDVFYFAKDFDTFYKAACWARANLNPELFLYSYTLAIYHRPDCRSFYVPPFYEIMPASFVPMETMHKFYNSKMMGMNKARLSYNSTGYEYSYHSMYHTTMMGGLLGMDNRGHGEYRISYFREDVGLNAWFTEWFFRNPSWYCNRKYNMSPVQKRGENFYELIHMILSRYALERVGTGLPLVEMLNYRKPVMVGYNPRVTYMNGQPMYIRPDNANPFLLNEHGVMLAETAERRIWEAIDAGMLWEIANKTLVDLTEDNGIEILGRIMYGSIDRPSDRYYMPVFGTGLDALAYIVSTASDRQMVGGALTRTMTALRDPVIYKLMTRLLAIFQNYKQTLGPYRKNQLMYNGVTVQNLEVDKLLTYFERFEYEMTNALPVKERSEYEQYRYLASQFRLNHKPYKYTVTVKSENAGDAMVRVFLGSSHDPEYRELSNSESRLTYFEIDRFPVSMVAGENKFERSSSESPFFVHDRQGMRDLYNSLNNAMSQKEQFYVRDGCRCGMPARLQLPMGWEGGRPSTMAVVVTPYDKTRTDSSCSPDIACGGCRLDDHRPHGFPFDRPADFSHVPNVYFKRVHIHHKDASDVNRP